jgi:hypothetical protein
MCFLFDGEISSNRIPKTKHVARNSGGRRTSPALKFVGWVALCRPDIRPSVRPPKPPLARHRAAAPARASSFGGGGRREGRRRGGGSEAQVFAPGLVLLFGPNSIFLDSLTQVMQFRTSESQLERTFNLARFR